MSEGAWERAERVEGWVLPLELELLPVQEGQWQGEGQGQGLGQGLVAGGCVQLLLLEALLEALLEGLLQLARALHQQGQKEEEAVLPCPHCALAQELLLHCRQWLHAWELEQRQVLPVA